MQMTSNKIPLGNCWSKNRAFFVNWQRKQSEIEIGTEREREGESEGEWAGEFVKEVRQAAKVD